MSASVVAAEAKLVIRLDTDQAIKDAEKIPVPKEGGGAAPATTVPKPPAGATPGQPGGGDRSVNPGGDGAGRRPGRYGPGGGGPDSAFDPIEHGKALAKTALSQGASGELYRQTLEAGTSAGKAALLAVPEVGPALAQTFDLTRRAAEIVRKYGPASTGILKEMGVPDAVLNAARATVSGLQSIKAKSDALEAAGGNLEGLGAAQTAFGPIDLDKLTEFATIMGHVNEFQLKMRATKEDRDKELMGRALGSGGAAILDKLTGGRSIR